jgi:hypothetical protein
MSTIKMSDTYASADDLIDGTTGSDADKVTLPNGKVIMVRGLTRDEHLWIGKGTDDAAVIEQRMISKGMVQPVMTTEQVKAWQGKAGTMVLKLVSDKIRDLSGFGEGAAKSALAEDGD